MAKIYAPPKEVGAVPELDSRININDYWAACDKYVQAVSDWAKANGSGDVAGEEIRFPVADGDAVYIVLSLKPVTLIHLPIGDAWQFQYDNRLTAADVRKEVRRRQAMARLFPGPQEAS